MTGTRKTTYLPNNGYCSIPSRKEFHRYASNRIDDGDFSTQYASNHAVGKVASAIKWTYSNEKKRNRNMKGRG